MNLFVDDTIWLTNGTIEDIELKLIRLETIFTKFGIKININKKIIYNDKWEAKSTNFGIVVNKECKHLIITLRLINDTPKFDKEKLNNCRINKQVYF